MSKIVSVLENSVYMLGFILFISSFSLIFALTAQHVFDMKPCILCLYQRIPFVITILCSFIGLVFVKHNMKVTDIMVLVSAFVFLANSVIAGYHSGVELGLWESFLEECNVGFSLDSISLEELRNVPLISCSDVPWKDPILGLSMANLNALMCAGLSILCFISWFLIRREKA